MSSMCPSNLSDLELVAFIEGEYHDLPEPIQRALNSLLRYATPSEGQHIKERIYRRGRDHHRASTKVNGYTIKPFPAIK